MSQLAAYLNHGDMQPFGFFPFGLLSMFGNLLVIAGVVVLAIWAFRAITNPMRPAQAAAVVPVESPYDILARRFAAGEISAEEFQRARDTLAGPPPTGKP